MHAVAETRWLCWTTMRAAEPDLDFERFCQVVLDWLHAPPGLDPSLAAAADVLTRITDPDLLAAEVLTGSDAHGALGASTVLSLWEAVRTLR